MDVPRSPFHRPEPIPHLSIPPSSPSSQARSSPARLRRFAPPRTPLAKVNPSFYDRAATQIETTAFGRVWDFVDFILNALFVGVYVVNTYYKDSPALPSCLLRTDVALAGAILTEFVPRFYFITSSNSSLSRGVWTRWYPLILTLLATLPVFYGAWMNPEGTNFFESGYWVFFFPCRFMRLYVCFRALVNANTFVSPEQNQIILIAGSLLGILMTVTAFVQLVENYQLVDTSVAFLDVFYFVSITAANGLSTDIVPDDTFSRLVILYVMIVGYTYIPKALAEFLSLVRRKSRYVHSYKPKQGISHVLVVGQFDVESLKTFLREFYCEDHGPKTLNVKVVILNPVEPDQLLISTVLKDPLYVRRVQYIRGSSISFHDLHKAHADKARACFVLSSVYGSRVGVGEVVATAWTAMDPSVADAQTLMRAMAMKKFNPHLPLHIQVLLPSNKIHFRGIADQIICIDEFKMGILAQNCVAPGFATLINDLTTSIPENSVATFEKNMRQLEGVGIGKRTKLPAWLKEYIDGAQNEIYPVRLSSSYTNVTFSEAAWRIYRTHDAVMFAIRHSESLDLADAAPRNASVHTNTGALTITNPLGYKLQAGDVVYVICRSAALASKIGEKCPTQISGDSHFAEAGLIHGRQQSLMTALEAVRQELLHPPPKASTSQNILEDRGRSDEPRVSFGGATMLAAVSSEPATYLLLKNHLVICALSTTFPKNISFLIAAFRQRQPATPIAILCESEPNSEIQAAFEKYGRVQVIRGSGKSREDLLRARIPHAARVVVLANQDIVYSERWADASTVLCILNIDSLGQEHSVEVTHTSDGRSIDLQEPFRSGVTSSSETFTMAEFIHIDNSKLVGAGADYYARAEIYGQSILPAFVAGHVFSQGTMLNGLLTQTYFNPFVADVLRSLLFPGFDGHPDPLADSPESNGTPPSEPVHLQSAEEHRAFPSYTGPSARQDSYHHFSFSEMPFSKPAEKETQQFLKHGWIQRKRLPLHLLHAPYARVVEYVLRCGGIPIGLYRTATAEDTESGREIKYVLCHPRSTLITRPDDWVYLFARESFNW
ncbi:calcium-activated BK potassium channel alpha subunit-domain-containing protein [Cladochytrium replicatum]|nr:calcium-activated BK potassium channel alpha subunit-domain-containing protein [Cladochytrium replicatum]